MFEGQPKGLYALALANTGERFGYYTMIAVFALFLRANFGLDAGWAGEIYGDFLMLVYFLPILGGIMADKFGFGRMVTIGIVIMFLGYLLLSIPLGGKAVGIIAMLVALVLISFGTGLFKGNLQVMVGNLYDDPQYADKRDAGFSLGVCTESSRLYGSRRGLSLCLCGGLRFAYSVHRHLLYFPGDFPSYRRWKEGG